MNASQAKWFVTGVAIGLLTAYAIIVVGFDFGNLHAPDRNREQPVLPGIVLDSMNAEIGKLRDANDALRTENSDLRDALRQQAAAVTGGAPDPAVADGTGRSVRIGTGDFAEIMRKTRETRIADTLTLLRSRLTLTDDQDELIRDTITLHLEARSAEKPFGFEPVFGLLEDEALLSLLDPILSPDQMEELAAYNEEQRANRVEVMANGQLMRLQTMVNLSAEQKDRAFQVFAETAEAAVYGDSANPPGDPAAAMEHNLEALGGILDAGQMAVYRSAIEREVDMIRRLREGVPEGSPAVRTRAVFVSPGGSVTISDSLSGDADPSPPANAAPGP